MLASCRIVLDLLSQLITAAQLSVIPRDYLHRFHKNHHAFSGLGCNHLAPIIIQRTARVTLPDHLTNLLDGLALVADNCLTLYLNSSQFVVTLTALYKAGQPGIASQVEGFLGFSICPENYLVIY